MQKPEGSTRTLVLEKFLPFRLNRLADAVSLNLSEIYRDRFGLEVSEWRVLVTVGQRGDCTAHYIASSTRMHKTRVSRAVACLLKRQLLERSCARADGREMQISLSGTGRRMYSELVPLALQREVLLFSCLSDPERSVLLDVLTRLEGSLRLTPDA